jgi:serine protease Do
MRINDCRKRRGFPRFLAVSSLFLFVLLFVPLSAFAEDKNSIATLRQMGKAFASIAEKASPAVVGVKTEKVITAEDYPSLREWPFGSPFSPFDDDFFERFFGYRYPRRENKKPEYRQHAQGSGFIISKDGYILTNNHLVGKAEKVVVKLADDREFAGKIIGADRDSDVAVVKIEAENLPYLEMADSDALEVGEWVIAIGNPFGLSHTVTAGIVSAKGRSGFRVAEFEDFIQTDAAINPGNSGGPLLNLDCKVVGISTAIIGPGGNIGIGLAIPINLAKNVYTQLIETGKVEHGFLGVTIQDLSPESAEFFELEDTTKGVLISDVTEDSAAEKAGIKPGDVVVEFEGHPVESMNDFRNRVAMKKPGSTVEITVLRDGKRKTLNAELDTWPEGGVTAVAGTPSEVREQLGITVQALTDELAKRLGYEGLSGVVVADVESDSPAERAGIKAGALIMEVNRKKINNPKDFSEAVKQASEEGKVLLLIKDDRFTRFVVLRLSED